MTAEEQVDQVFEDEVLASLYDYFNPWTRADDFYFDLAREIGGNVLDLGCGTGMLACRIASEGLSVTGVDPAKGMLRVAASRNGGDRVNWINGDGRTLDLNQRFDFVYMTGHAFQALRTDDDALALLRSVSDHLTTGGRFAFESRNPAQMAWLAWNRKNTRVATTPEHGRIEESYDVALNEDTGLVELTHYYRFLDQGRTEVGRSRLRFVSRCHLERLIAAARLKPVAWYGDWDRGALNADSHEFIVVACLA
jgi:SAM-dependent methyltransferase